MEFGWQRLQRDDLYEVECALPRGWHVQQVDGDVANGSAWVAFPCQLDRCRGDVKRSRGEAQPCHELGVGAEGAANHDSRPPRSGLPGSLCPLDEQRMRLVRLHGIVTRPSAPAV